MTKRQEIETIAGRLREQLSQCAGYEGDQVAADREEALNYYYQRERGDEVAGRSNVVAGDVSAMVEANLAQMLESLSSDQIAEFDADGPEDDDQAQLESFAVTSAVMRDNNGHQVLGWSVKDGLLLRNGWVKVFVEESRHAETLELENVEPETIAGMQEMPGLEVEAKAYDAEAKTATVRVVKVTKKFRVESVDPANMLYPKQWHSLDVQRIPFIAERHIESRDELLRRGFPKKAVLAAREYQQDSKIDTSARDVRRDPGTRTGIDRSQELVEWFECYALVDSGDGTSERRRYGLLDESGPDAILEDVPASLVPYATGSPFLNPHRLTGISLFDKLKQTQDLNTGLQRGLLDNLNAANKNRTYYLDGKVNSDDLSDGRINNDIRVKASVGDVRTAVTHAVVPDLSAGILENLGYQRQVRTELGGASLELATGQMQMAGGRIGSQGVDRAFSVMEQLAAHMTKNIATSLVRGLFLLAHATMRENFDEPVDVKINGRWDSPTPSQWRPRTRVTVKLGMSPGERARKAQALGQIVQSQFDLANQDMDDVLVDIGGFYRALTDWGRTVGLPNPEQYYLDPASESSQAALKRKTEAQQRNRQAEENMMSQAIGLEQMRAAIDKYRGDQETQFKYWRETLLAEIEEAKIVGKATLDLIQQTKFGGKSTNGKEPTEKPGAGNGATDD